MKHTWFWDAETCVRELGNLLHKELSTYDVSVELAKDYENPPSSSAIIGQLRRKKLPKRLEEVFGTTMSDTILREYHARGDKTRKRKSRNGQADSSSPADVPSLVVSSERVAPPTVALAHVSFRRRALREDSSPEDYLAQYFENEAVRDSRIGLCRGKNDTCPQPPIGGPYCPGCGEALYKPAYERKSADRHAERTVRRSM